MGKCTKCCRTRCVCKTKCYDKCDPCDPCGKSYKSSYGCCRERPCGSCNQCCNSKCYPYKSCNSCYKCCGKYYSDYCGSGSGYGYGNNCGYGNSCGTGYGYGSKCCPTSPCGSCSQCCGSSNGCYPNNCGPCNPWVPSACSTNSCYSNSVPFGSTPSDYLFWEGTCWKIGSSTVRIGSYAGATGQGSNAVALGASAGRQTQGSGAVAVGYQAAQTNQASNAVAIGNIAAGADQLANAIAIGSNAAGAIQGANAIAIGQNAVAASQVAGSVVVSSAGLNNPTSARGILLNASGAAVTLASAGLYANPVRGDTQGGVTTVLVYDSGTSEISYDLSTTKTFVVNHPLDKDRYLVHACLEGPESGVFYRGESETEGRAGKFTAEVSLPSYAAALADNFSVQITPIGTSTNFSVSKVQDGKFSVQTSDACEFFWTVFARRGEINVEPKKEDVRVSGDGPYKYIY